MADLVKAKAVTRTFQDREDGRTVEYVGLSIDGAEQTVPKRAIEFALGLEVTLEREIRGSRVRYIVKAAK